MTDFDKALEAERETFKKLESRPAKQSAAAPSVAVWSGVKHSHSKGAKAQKEGQ